MNNLLAFTTDSEIELASQRIPPSFMDVSKLLVRATFELSTPKNIKKIKDKLYINNIVAFTSVYKYNSEGKQLHTIFVLTLAYKDAEA